MSDEWDFYVCQVDDHPASIFVDLGIHDEVPISDLDELAWLRLFLRQPREDGLSGKVEYNRLCEIEDAITRTLASARRKIAYVGRSTFSGRRDFFFYAANGTQAERLMTTVMDPFPEYEFEVGSRPDSDWSTYREFLHPSRRIYQTILNRRVLDSLAKHGDRHDIEREVTHWIYFQSPEERGRYLSNAVAKGYKVGRTVVAQGDDAKGERRFGLTLSRCHAVDFGTINDMVLELFDLAEECAGDYDGWETSVEKGE